MKVRVRTGSGIIPLELDTTSATLGLLKIIMEEHTGIQAEQQSYLAGYPPKSIDGDNGTLLTQLGVLENDQLILSVKGQTSVKQGFSKDVYIPPMDEKCVVVIRDVPADNSCLFHTAAYLLENRSRALGPKLRGTIAEVVAAHPQKFTKEFLGMPNQQYCHKIQDPNFWGGAIELSVLSFIYSLEIIAFDRQTQREDRYGSDQNYSRMAMVIYTGSLYLLFDLTCTGNHYMALAVSPYWGAPESADHVIVSSKDKQVLTKARNLVEVEFKKQFKH